MRIDLKQENSTFEVIETKQKSICICQHRCLRKFVASFLLFAMIVTIIKPITISAISQSEVEEQLDSLMKQYVGTTWNDYFYGVECKGFANLIFNNLFGVYIGPYDEDTKAYIPNPNGAYEVGRLDAEHMSVDGAKTLLLKGKPGDFIQVRRRDKTWGHSMILVSTDADGITVFDCNSDAKNGVRSYHIDWDTFYSGNSAMSLYHAENYTENNTVQDVSGDNNDSKTKLKKGDTFRLQGAVYEVTSSSKRTVKFVSLKKSSVKTYQIPATLKYNNTTYKITRIAKNAFKNNKKLKIVTIGKNVTYIGAYAFYGNSKLATVTIKSKKITTIGKKAFRGISKKVVVKAPSAVKSKYKKMMKKAGLGK